MLLMASDDYAPSLLSETVRDVLPDAPDRQVERTCSTLLKSGYVNGVTVAEFNGADTINAELTVEGLQQLDLWPSDNERGLYMLQRLGAAIEKVADDLASSPTATPEEISKLRLVATGLLSFGSNFAAQVAATMVTR